MLNFANPLTNEDPLANELHLETLRTVPYAMALILSNFPGFLTMFYLIAIREPWTAASVGWATGISIFYHISQTTTYSFLLSLALWTLLDHFSAPQMNAMLILYIINWRLIRDDKGRLTPERYARTAPFSTLWVAFINYSYLWVCILATVAHPFSMQSFIIVIGFGLAAAFFKLVIIDQCNVRHFEERISKPDLIVGCIMVGLSLVFFVLDSWIFYEKFHTLWHTLSLYGIPFFVAGVSRNSLYFFSLVLLIYDWFRRRFPVLPAFEEYVRRNKG